MDNTKDASVLFQTPDQRTAGTATYRVYIDQAWRNVEGPSSWKNLPQKELIRVIEEAYYTPK